MTEPCTESGPRTPRDSRGARHGSPRVDAHHHLWDLAVRDQPWTEALPDLRRTFDFTELLALLDTHAIDATVLVQTVCVPQETPEMLALAQSMEALSPRIAGVVGWVDLTAADIRERLDALQAAPGGQHLVGIRHQVQEEEDPGWLLRADVRRGLRAVADAGLVFDVLVRHDQLATAAELATVEPGVQFVLDHAGKPDLYTNELETWKRHLRRLAGPQNVTVKLSGLTSYPGLKWTPALLQPVVDELLETFGPTRTMFGSDWPVCLLGGDYDATLKAVQTLAGSLSDTERDSIFGLTAIRAYGLAL